MAKSRGRFTWRMATFVVFLTLATGGLVARLAYIQIVHHDRYTLEAQAEHLEKQPIRSSRGAILDRNGFPLATSIDVFDIYVDRRAWREDAPDRPQRVATALAPLLGKPAATLLARLQDDADGPVELLADGVDFEIGRQIEGLALPGVIRGGGHQALLPGRRRRLRPPRLPRPRPLRPRRPRGRPRRHCSAARPAPSTSSATAAASRSPSAPVACEPGKPGADVRLTIDRYIQRLIENELDKQIKDHQASGGSIIVMDPKTGAILAMASRPSFKLSQLTLDTPPPLDLFRNRAVTDLYEPGSVIKTSDHGHGHRPRPRQARHHLLRQRHRREGRLHLQELGLQRQRHPDDDPACCRRASTPAPSGSATTWAPTTSTPHCSASASAKTTHSGLGGEATACCAPTKTRAGTRPTSRRTATARASPPRRCR